jgi:molecular chaperone IbpA
MVAHTLHREILKNFWLGHNPAWFDQMDMQTNYPRYNIVEGKSGFKLEVAVPGWNKKQLKVVQKDNELRIVGTKSTEGGDNYLHQGLSAKSFDKTFVLNSDLKVNSIKLKDGLLTVDITKDSSKEVEFDIS